MRRFACAQREAPAPLPPGCTYVARSPGQLTWRIDRVSHGGASHPLLDAKGGGAPEGCVKPALILQTEPAGERVRG